MSQTGARQPVGAAFYDVIGHSIPGGGGVTSGDWNGYVDKLMYLLGTPRRRRNFAIGGAISCAKSFKGVTGDGGWSHPIWYVTPPSIGGGSGPYLPQSDITVVHAALNDLALLGQANPVPMQEAHRTILGRMVAAALAQSSDTSLAFTGTWTSGLTRGYNSPGGYRQTSTIGDTATWTIPADYPGGRTVGLNILFNPAHDLTIGITIDGIAQPNVRLNSAICAPNGYNAAGAPEWMMKCLRYPIVAAGQHTVTIQLLTQTIAGSTLYLDSAHIESDPADGPIVVIPNNHRCLNYGLWSGAAWANGGGMSDAAVAAWNTSLARVASEFPHVMIVDIDAALGKNPALFSTDGAHPNNQGHGVIAQTIYDSLTRSNLLTSRRVSRVSPILAPPAWQEVGANVNSWPTFMNAWTNYGAPYSTVGYYKDLAGRVHLRGVAKNGSTPGAVIFQLPANFRPPTTRMFPTSIQGGTIGVLQVSADGSVQAAAGGNVAGIFLDGVSFIAEQ